MFTTARTFLSNFKLPCLYVALFAGVIAAGGSWYARGKWDAGEIAKAQNETLQWKATLSDYKASVATATSSALTIGFARQTDAADAVRALRDDITTSLAKGHAELLKAVKTRSDTFRSATDDAKYRCLDIALPDSALRVYERAGGSATPAPTDRD